MALPLTQTGTQVVACAASLLLVSTVAVTLRLISRGYILHILGPTDWFMVLTLVFAFATTISVGTLAANGFGYHMADLTGDEVQGFFKAMYVAMLLSSLSMYMTKISVLLLFLDIFVITWVRKATYVVMALVVSYGLWLTISTVVFCLPVYSFWDIYVPGRQCFNFSAKWTADAAVNFSLEILIFCLPLSVLGPLRLPRRQKLWICFAFSLGIFVCTVSGLRFHYLDFTQMQGDPTYGGVMIAYWFTIEINVPIVIACIPTVKPLIARWCPRLLESAPSRSELSSDVPNPPTVSSTPNRTEGLKMYHI